MVCACYCALVNSEGKILVVRRSKGFSFSGLWDLPGGTSFEKEPVLDTLKREILEETGVTLNGNAKHLHSSMVSFPNKSAINIHYFFAPISSSEIFLSKEHDMWMWIDKSDFNSFSFVFHVKSFFDLGLL